MVDDHHAVIELSCWRRGSDLFLFADHVVPDASARLARKRETQGIRPDTVLKRLDGLGANHSQHVAAVDHVIHEQLDPEAAESPGSGP